MGEFSANETSSEIIPALWSRSEVVLKHTGGSDVWLAFGEAATVASAVRLSSDMPVVVIDDDRAVLSINAICEAGEECTGEWDWSTVAAKGVTYQTLASEVGAYLGYGDDSASWSSPQSSEIDRYIQAGIRMFYFPPAAPGIEPGYDWSFLRPTTTITTVKSTQVYSLPDDFSRVIGGLAFDSTERAPSVAMVGIGRLYELNQGNESETRPRVAAVRVAKTQSMLSPLENELMLWPVPDAAYTLSYQYEAYAGRLDATRRFPLGCQSHGETIIAACLAVAEMRANDSRGFHWENFISLLAGSIAKDRKQGALHYGYMGDFSGGGGMLGPLWHSSSSYEITYKGEVL